MAESSNHKGSLTGLASVIAVLSALRERDRTGKGQLVEPALRRTAANFVNYQMAGYTENAIQELRASRAVG